MLSRSQKHDCGGGRAHTEPAPDRGHGTVEDNNMVGSGTTGNQSEKGVEA